MLTTLLGKNVKLILLCSLILSNGAYGMEKESCTEGPQATQRETYLVKYQELMASIEKQDHDEVNELLIYARRYLDYSSIVLWINRTDSRTGELPITLAVETGNLRIIQLLKYLGAMPELYNDNQVSAIELATIKMLDNHDEGSKIVEILISDNSFQHGESLADLSDNLISAIQDGDFNRARIVLKENQNCASKIANYYNAECQFLPLSLAIKNKNLAMVKLLIDAHADPILLGENYSEGIIDPKFQSSIDNILGTAMKQNPRNATILNLNLNALEILPLIMNSIEKNDFNYLGQIIKYLAEGIPNDTSVILNQIYSKNQHTPLTLAVKKQQITLVKELLKLGANPLLPNKQGKTALDIAAHKNETLGIGNSLIIWKTLQQSCLKLFE